MLRVHSLESFGTHDGPGIRYIIFLQGCLFRCLYCHNPDTIALNGGNMMDENELLEKILKSKAYFGKKGGVTISGGEPMLQAKNILPLIEKLKSLNIHSAIDTNGYILDEDAKKVFQLADLILLDVKHINPKIHKDLTGQENTKVLQTAQYLNDIDKKTWLRYVFVPGWSDQDEFLHQWADTLSKHKNFERVEILPYHRLGEYKRKALGRKYKLQGVLPPNSQQLGKAKNIFEKYFQCPIYIR